LSEDSGKLRNHQGFTLLEVVVVLVFIGLIASLTTPYLMSTLDRVKHQAETRKINSALRFARSEAITRKTVFTFNGDTQTRKYWISAREKNRPATARIRTLAPGLTMAHTTSEEDKLDNGKFAINFYPRGNSSGGIIRVTKISSDKSESAYEITIDPITGTSRINQEAQ
jgi:prepilin-type N-terminal cleavage/methylation domain-containing protein